MEHHTQLLKFVLGICIVTSCVRSSSVKLYYGCDPNNPNKDVTGQELDREKAQQLMAQFQKANENMQQKLETAENERDQAVKELAAMKQKNQKDIGICQERFQELMKEKQSEQAGRMPEEKTQLMKQNEELVEKLTEEKNKLIKENIRQVREVREEKIQLMKENRELEQKMKEKTKKVKTSEKLVQELRGENDQLMKEDGEISKQLKKAQVLHSRVLEAMSETGQNNLGLIRFPHLESINELRRTVNFIISVTAKKQRVNELSLTKEKLENLLQILYAEGKISDVKQHKDVEREINEMETETTTLRDQQLDQRNAILKKLKEKDLADCDEEDISALTKANAKIAKMNDALQVIARQRVYLHAIIQVADLIKECS